MIELSRQSIVEGILELQREEEFKLKSALKSIRLILDEDGISDFDKLKFINCSAWRYNVCLIYKMATSILR